MTNWRIRCEFHAEALHRFAHLIADGSLKDMTHPRPVKKHSGDRARSDGASDTMSPHNSSNIDADGRTGLRPSAYAAGSLECGLGESTRAKREA